MFQEELCIGVLYSTIFKRQILVIGLWNSDVVLYVEERDKSTTQAFSYIKRTKITGATFVKLHRFLPL